MYKTTSKEKKKITQFKALRTGYFLKIALCTLMKRGELCSAVLSQEVALNSVKLQLQIDVFHEGTGQSHKNTQEEERQGRDLPPCLKGTEITQLEQAKTVNGALDNRRVSCFLTNQMLLVEEVTGTQSLTRHCDQSYLLV